MQFNSPSNLILKHQAIPLFVLLFAFSCNLFKNERPIPFSHKVVKGDTTIIDAFRYNDLLICVQSDHKIFGLDSNYNKVTFNLFDSIEVRGAYANKNEIFIFGTDSVYQLLPDDKLKTIKTDCRNSHTGLYRDEVFNFIGCRMGEWSSSFFIMERNTTDTYFLRISGNKQVLEYNGNYHIAYSAAPWGYFGHITIHSPYKLEKLTDVECPQNCNRTPSISDEELSDLNAITKYGESHGYQLQTFIRNENLYSIVSYKSSTVLKLHKNNQLFSIDTLMNRHILFAETETNYGKNEVITAFHTSGAYGSVDYQNTGILITNDEGIKLIEFDTPHKPKHNWYN